MMRLKEVPLTDVEIHDAFWSPRLETNRTATIPHCMNMLEQKGYMRNFELAAAGAREGYSGPVFMDSDAYKVFEAASYSLATHPDPVLENRLDEMLAKVAAAQMKDGYLNTHFQVNEPDKRWTNLRDKHELYCAGHLIEAAVAHYKATGKRTLLDVAIRFADHIDSVFGDGPGKRMGYPGHPEIELALVKLWRLTGEKRYFNLARFFIENRGQKFFAKEHNIPLDKYDGTNLQDNMPIRQYHDIVGHAVRACYLMAGVVDVASETGDEGLLKMVNRTWRSAALKRMYITGGVGSSAAGERFTVDYDLPNLTAYQETCATIAMVFWNHRMNLLYGDAKYADIVETALYNGVLAGVSLVGNRFFYVNPLTSMGNHHRSEWFGCACCPPNVARILASLGNYVCALSEDALWLNLYIQGKIKTRLGGKELHLDITTDYPWEGDVKVAIQSAPPQRFGLRLRIPGWCSDYSVRINGAPLQETKIDHGYLVLEREWKAGDQVELKFAMPVRMVEAHPLVKEDVWHVALQRGPIVYCLEDCDQEVSVTAIGIPRDSTFTPQKCENLLGGVVVLKGRGEIYGDDNWTGRLYRTYVGPKPLTVTAIPYCVWDNRQPGAMKVWIPQLPPPPVVGGLETKAQVSISFQHTNCQPWGINDGIEPESSSKQSASQCHWWPHKGTEEWVQYTWKQPVTVSGAKVYWFDDTGRGECRLPASWKILYLEGNTWKPVAAKSDYPIQKDRWCEVRFETVKTTALRLVVQMQKGWAAGVHEWKVLTDEDK